MSFEPPICSILPYLLVLRTQSKAYPEEFNFLVPLGTDTTGQAQYNDKSTLVSVQPPHLIYFKQQCLPEVTQIPVKFVTCVLYMHHHNSLFLPHLTLMWQYCLNTTRPCLHSQSSNCTPYSEESVLETFEYLEEKHLKLQGDSSRLNPNY